MFPLFDHGSIPGKNVGSQSDALHITLDTQCVGSQSDALYITYAYTMWGD